MMRTKSESAFNYAMNPDYFHPEYLNASEYPQSYGALTEEFYEGCIRPVLSEYRQLTPWAIMASATFLNPARFAPATRS